MSGTRAHLFETYLGRRPRRIHWWGAMFGVCRRPTEQNVLVMLPSWCVDKRRTQVLRGLPMVRLAFVCL